MNIFFMEKEDIWNILALICGILTLVFTYMGNFAKSKKEELNSKRNPVNQPGPIIVNVKKGDYVTGQKTENHKNESTNSKSQEVHNDYPSALIVTHGQTGGENVVNINGGKSNPANVTKKPIFDESGYYGLNILNENTSTVKKELHYSFSAKIPRDTKLKVIIQRIGEEKRPFWGTEVSSQRPWRNKLYDGSKDFSQEYDLDDEIGDMHMIFSESGAAKIKIFYNEKLIQERNIKCE